MTTNTTTTTTTSTADQLRSQIDAIENKKIILASQRDDIAFRALVDREPAAIKQAAEINAKLAELTTEEAMLNAALKTANKREAEAKAAEQAKQKHADLDQAASMLAEAEQMAQQIDAAMKTLHQVTTAFEGKWATIKRLSGGGPAKTHLMVLLSAVLKDRIARFAGSSDRRRGAP